MMSRFMCGFYKTGTIDAEEEARKRNKYKRYKYGEHYDFQQTDKNRDKDRTWI